MALSYYKVRGDGDGGGGCGTLCAPPAEEVDSLALLYYDAAGWFARDEDETATTTTMTIVAGGGGESRRSIECVIRILQLIVSKSVVFCPCRLFARSMIVKPNIIYCQLKW